MSTPTQEINYNVTGQSIYLDATEGRPSAVTSVEVFTDTTGDDGTAQAATTGSASVESTPSTTVDATSGSGENNPRKLSLAATTGIEVGRVYLLRGSSSEREWAEVREVVSGDYVILRSPLHNTFVTGDAFESTRMSISIDSTWIADTSNISDDHSPNPGYRVRWVYVYNSETFVKDTYLDVVRYKAMHNVTPADMERFLPSWRNILPTYHREDNGRALIDEAYQQIKFDLYAHDLADEMLRDREAVDELVKQKSREVLLVQRFYETGASPEVADDARTQYQSRLQSLVTRTAKVPFGVDSSGASTNIITTSIWSR
jgi:hypothetical protein